MCEQPHFHGNMGLRLQQVRHGMDLVGVYAAAQEADCCLRKIPSLHLQRGMICTDLLRLVTICELHVSFKDHWSNLDLGV